MDLFIFIIMFVGHGLMMFMMPVCTKVTKKNRVSMIEYSSEDLGTIKNREQRIKRRTAYNKI